MSDEQDKQESLIEYPCKFPIKIVGKQHDGETEVDFEKEIVTIFEKHFDKLEENAVRKRESEKGTYLSLTVTVMAESKEQLDAVYQDLTDHHLTHWVL